MQIFLNQTRRLARNAFGCSPRSLARFFDRPVAALLGGSSCLAFSTDFVELFITKVFDTYEGIARSTHADQFVQFDLNGCAISVLRILNKKDHQKRHNCCAGVDDQLPRIREVKNRPAYCPNRYYSHSD